MFFQDHEKAIYSPESLPDAKFDPLAVDRALVKATHGMLHELLVKYQPVTGETGDVSKEGRRLAEVEKAEAEEQLIAAARIAFGMKEFPENTDGQILEVLHDYLEWMEGKGSRVKHPPTSQPSSESPVSAL